jgi:HK97 family phage major capsid protein
MLLIEEARKLSLNKFQKGVITEIVTRSALFARLPVMPVVGKAYQYTRENTIGVATWVGPNGRIKESTATYDTITTSLKSCIGDADVDDFLEETHSDQQSPMALQIRAKTKVVLREIQRVCVKGDSSVNPLEPDGVQKLVTTGQTVGANNDAAQGGAVGFKDLDRCKAKVKVGTPSFWLANNSVEIEIRELYRSKNIEPPDIALENFRGPSGGTPKFLMLHGLPIFIEDNITQDETKGTSTDCSSMYIVATDDDEGLTGLISRSGAGIRVKVIGTLPDKDADRVRVKMYFGTALRSTLAVARCEGIRLT